ncbi:hypothetical protein [Paenibacillus marinisediminis]
MFNNCNGNFDFGFGQEEGIRRLLFRIGIGTRISVHFDCTHRTGKFLGIHDGSVLITSKNVPFFIPIRKILAIDLPPE